MLFPKLPTRREGWAAGLHTHHDHGADAARYGLPGPRRMPRFPDEVICEQCNAADAAAKRKLDLPRDFSFAPFELRRFVTATPHGFHEVDYETALAVYGEIGWR